MGERLASKVLLIGWDAADWKIINPLLDQGLMPTLKQFIEEGVMGNIATLRPVLSPMLWNSIGTGKRADKHGILHFVEPDPNTGNIRPVASTSRKVKAIWNILTQKGFHSNVVGWWAGHPAEPISGVSVSNLYPGAGASGRFTSERAPMAADAVHPASLADTLANLRIHPSDLTAQTVLPFIPLLKEVDQSNDQHLEMFAKVMAECCTIHNAGTWILENQPWDFAAIYYNAIDHFCHGFMNFHPPRLSFVPEDQFELYKDVVTGAYKFHDMMLERLLHLAGPDATVIIVSDHGFHSDHLRPTSIPRIPAGPAAQHRNLGIVCMRGPNILKDEPLYGASLLDITPTILTLFGLPVGQDMDGKVLVQVFDKPMQVETIPSWEDVPGECGMHSKDVQMDPEAAKAVLEQFIALGYIQPLTGDMEKRVRETVQESNYNLAQVYLDAQRADLALPVLKSLAEQAPDVPRYAILLANCHMRQGELTEAREVLERVMQKRQEPGHAEIMLAVIANEEGRLQEALDYLSRAEEAQPRLPWLHEQIGRTYLNLKRPVDAERSFRKAIEIDHESPQGHGGLAASLIKQKRFQEALESALTAVGLTHFFPQAHLNLGIALARMRHFDRAIQAFELALSLNSGLALAHRWLARLYSRRGGSPEKARMHRDMAIEMRTQRLDQVEA